MDSYVIVNRPEDFPFKIEGVQVVSAKAYLTEEAYGQLKKLRVFNLCRSYRYQSLGYYVSLLATARGHRVMPDILTIQDTKTQAIIRLKSEEFEGLIQKMLFGIKSEFYNLNVYFGQTVEAKFRLLGAALFTHFRAPLLTAYFVKTTDRWKLQDVDPVSPRDLPDNHPEHVEAFAREFFGRKQGKTATRKKYRYSMAILTNAEEMEPPSNKGALKNFERAANRQGFEVEFITKEDYNRLAEFDALFIRETTSVNHHTYRISRKAAVEGLVVIDDPESILRCSNKVYLAELMNLNGIRAPQTIVLNKEMLAGLPEQMALPIVLKQPDSAFSQGVTKAHTLEELMTKGKALLTKSELILAQEFLPTSFDWRVGIIDGEPLYVCQYYMADNHWQIMNWEKKRHDDRYGNYATMRWEDAPGHVVETALKAAKLIGNGLYGVDIKECDGKAYVIEVNDNPSIESNIEDQILGKALYDRIMEVFKARLG